METEKKIIQILSEKSTLKQQVFDNTLDTFRILKDVLQKMVFQFNNQLEQNDQRVHLSYKDRGLYQAELKVAGDLLIFYMHSNIFEFDRAHGVWKTSYIQDNSMSSYSGVINIYNFLADSFKYNRMDDLGYLIGRIFINKDKHFFVEGKRQLGFLYNNFATAVISAENLKSIIESAMLYALDFDLLVPPYNDVKITNVATIQEKRNKSMIVTGKRLGFQFNADDVGDSITYSGG